MKDLSNYRRSYEKGALTEGVIPDNPIALFALWFDQTEEAAGILEVNTMTLSTCAPDGSVHARIVLLKQFSAEGFTFYTNYLSQKGRDIEHAPNVCLSFFWPTLERQVIVTGIAEKVSDADSDEYFGTRPRGSQLGAWASNQSEEVTSREVFEKRLHELERAYADKPIPRPPHWGGYLVRHQTIEFWQGRPNRLHDRIRYAQNQGIWNAVRLSP